LGSGSQGRNRAARYHNALGSAREVVATLGIAVALGVYALSAPHLVARNASTGTLIGTFPGDSVLRYPPVIASDHVFVASDANVYALNTTTLESVWTAPSGGWLAVAAKRLFIARTNGRLDTYVFQN
jgi:outer membrane protein assembly factor BamB